MKTATMRTIARTFLSVFLVSCALSLLAILSACGGGGDDEQDDDTKWNPVNCQKSPEACK